MNLNPQKIQPWGPRNIKLEAKRSINIGNQKSRNPKVQKTKKKPIYKIHLKLKRCLYCWMFFQLFARGFQLELNEGYVQSQLRGNFLFWGGFTWKKLKSLSVPAESLEQNCIHLHGILQIKLDIHWTPRKTLVLGRQPFQHIPSSWNHKVGCHDISKSTSENLKILFNPWIGSIF